MTPLRAVALCLFLAGCSVGPTSVAEGDCIAVLRFQGALYVPTTTLYQGYFTPGEVVGEVKRNLGCHDQPVPGDPAPESLGDGDSNFLPPGTLIYSELGSDVSERVMVHPDTIWITMEPLDLEP